MSRGLGTQQRMLLQALCNLEQECGEAWFEVHAVVRAAWPLGWSEGHERREAEAVAGPPRMLATGPRRQLWRPPGTNLRRSAWSGSCIVTCWPASSADGVGGMLIVAHRRCAQRKTSTRRSGFRPATLVANLATKRVQQRVRRKGIRRLPADVLTSADTVALFRLSIHK